MSKLQEISFACHETAFSFLRFLDALHNGRDNSDSYHSFRDSASKVVWRSGIAQEGMLEFREDMRIVIGRIKTILSNDDRDISSFVTESGQSLLELATGVEECNAALEEYREEFKEVQQQSSNVNNSSPSEEEFRMVQQKWQVFKEISGPNAYRWQTLKREMRAPRAPKGRDKLSRRSYSSTSPTKPAGSMKSRRIPFWKNLFYRSISCGPLEKYC
ncbi:hypothetical protein AGABI2DRAFT_144347 [Agaricus bisporus var. bisporus H97]|uniref:hypothetical protein n=1 Tax=Agaricus bisporus var. bisporus (strain H97 / ATCC MYA-4626 / FGSC 10389) TaxID=936046 RepID=UPI00029F723B|nr:hypothetical protein AGABI2DRAFT_144347 [Agaricus bisporus var. bisporus H97]EKV46078.1 hypothetical protein AGABI2DRAFT_144347 [Agaricus bisporus var. bisporus H97]